MRRAVCGSRREVGSTSACHWISCSNPRAHKRARSRPAHSRPGRSSSASSREASGTDRACSRDRSRPARRRGRTAQEHRPARSRPAHTPVRSRPGRSSSAASRGASGRDWACNTDRSRDRSRPARNKRAHSRPARSTTDHTDRGTSQLGHWLSMRPAGPAQPTPGEGHDGSSIHSLTQLIGKPTGDTGGTGLHDLLCRQSNEPYRRRTSGFLSQISQFHLASRPSKSGCTE